MSEYTKKSWLYIAAVVVIATMILYFRSEGFNEGNDWSKAEVRKDARSYREYCTNWRTGPHAAEAYVKWEELLKSEYEHLDWSSPYAVKRFIEDHPEFGPEEVLTAQYQFVLKDGSYDALKKYLDCAADDDPHRKEISGLIDAMIMKEVKSAVDSDDYQELRQLSKKYSGWAGRDEWIDSRIKTARENAARKEWNTMSSTRSEKDLRRFISKYSGTDVAACAKERIDSLYEDFDFVKTKGSLRAYSDFVKKHPNSPQVNEAYRYIANELEDYVFKRKNVNSSDESLARSLLAEYKQNRPSSGLLYGGGGYYTSPLQITTPGYGGDDYFVKLVNNRTGKSVGIFVRNGTTTEVSVPDGTYSVRYATGSQWYGTRFLFGFDAHYSRASQDFTFSNGSGYTLTLKKVAHGNLHTSSMSAKDF